MAAPMPHGVRLKLNITGSLQKQLDAFWYLVNTHQIQTILDLELDISNRFSLDSRAVSLYLDGCWLPNSESAGILRDNDAINVRVASGLTKEETDTHTPVSAKVSVEDVLQTDECFHGRRKKKRKTKSLESEETSHLHGNVQMSADNDIDGRQDFLSIHRHEKNDENSLTDTQKCKKHKRNRHISEGETAEHIPPCRQQENVSYNRKHEEKVEDSVDDTHTQKRKKHKRKKHFSESETEGQTISCHKQGDKNLLGNTADVEENPVCQNNRTEPALLIANPLKRQRQKVSLEIVEGNDEESRDGGSNQNTQENNEKASKVENTEPHLAEVPETEKKKRTRRRRKRSRPNIQTSQGEETATNTTSPFESVEAKGFSGIQHRLKNMSRSTSHYSDNKWIKQNGGDHVHFESDNEEMDTKPIVPSVKTNACPDQGDNGCRENGEKPEHEEQSDHASAILLKATEADCRSEESSTDLLVNAVPPELLSQYTIVPPPDLYHDQQQPEHQQQPQQQSQQCQVFYDYNMEKKNKRKPFKPSPQDLLGDVQVFNRRARRGGVNLLSKEAQLNSVLSNKSIIIQNPIDGLVSGNLNDIQRVCSEEGDEKKEDKEDVEGKETDLPIKDYASMPVLHGAPRVGDIIAYKVLEMSETYCPEISDFKEAKVLQFDHATSSLELEIIRTPNKGRREGGRFDVVLEYDSEVLTNVVERQAKVNINLASLVDVHLVTV